MSAPRLPEEIQSICELIWEGERVKEQYQISLLLCGDEEIRELNHQYRGCDAVTDVLSFETEALPKSGARLAAIHLCDIVIDTNRVYSQKGTRSFKDEFDAVLVHSFLHLLGYDHIKSKDKEQMEEKEEFYKHKIQGVN
ncbi:MAG: rRNA maturation RNase YbeY [Candidatus Cloacimonadota bacterium]